jgi:REP element-mobilizing transposase RayT
MANTTIYPGQLYHVYNRGVNRQLIFFNEGNYDFFIRRMKRYFVPSRVDVLAYCLMPTHFHILIVAKLQKFGTRVMQPFATSYVKAINRQQRRVGPLFQGPYRARQVTTDGDLVHLSRYIHLNPVVAGLVSSPAEWRYSSYEEYLGTWATTFLRKEKVLSYFDSPEEYQAFVEDPSLPTKPRSQAFG